MKQTTLLLVTLLYTIFSFAQSQKELNTITLRGEDFKEETSTVLSCDANCITVDKDAGFIAFSLTGKIGERTIVVSCETPVLKGTKKIRVDKDGDPNSHQKFTIEIFGSNPAVDKDVYEIQGESDEAMITIQRLDETNGELSGNFTVKYVDNTTGIKKLGASCRFLIRQK